MVQSSRTYRTETISGRPDDRQCYILLLSFVRQPQIPNSSTHSSTMLGSLLALVLLGLGAWAAPALPQGNQHLRNADAPPGCIVWIWNVWNLCIIAPPSSTIGPSTKRDNVETFAVQPATNPIPEGCLVLIPGEWLLCIVAPPTSTIGPSTKRETLVDRFDNNPTATSTSDCVAEIWEQYNICVIAPPASIIGTSSAKARRDWYDIGQPMTGGLIPDKTIPGGGLIADHHVPGGAPEPDHYVPGGQITPST